MEGIKYNNIKNEIKSKYTKNMSTLNIEKPESDSVPTSEDEKNHTKKNKSKKDKDKDTTNDKKKKRKSDKKLEEDSVNKKQKIDTKTEKVDNKYVHIDKKTKDKDNNITNGASNKAQNIIDEHERMIQKSKEKKIINPDEIDKDGNLPIKNFNIQPILIENLSKRNITHMFPIQASTYDTIQSGVDLIGRAKTGTGKTLAFTLPILHKQQSNSTTNRSNTKPRVLVLSPTRELAIQISKEFELTAPSTINTLCIYGGISYNHQEYNLQKGIDVIVGTCGRIKDLIDKGTLKLQSIEYVVLDEADEMLNMGFQDDVEYILKIIKNNDNKINKNIQILLFSATIPSWVSNVAKKFLQTNYKTIDLVKEQKIQVATTVQHIAIPCSWTERNNILWDIILVYAGKKKRTIIFVNTKKEASEILSASSSKNDCQAIHGDIPQNQREITLQMFRDGKFNCLVATDVAARGIDIQGVELIVQCEPPINVETYVHRSGRTGRANNQGICITLYTRKQQSQIDNIERRTGIKFQRKTIPNHEDIIRASSYSVLESLMCVDDTVIPLFEDTAKAIIEKKGAIWAVASALAVISGNTKPLQQRSLLTTSPDMITIHVSCNEEQRSFSPIWFFIRRWQYPEPDNYVRGMSFTSDKRGAVFDIPNNDAIKEKIKQIKDSRYTIRIVQDNLPPIIQQNTNQRGGNTNNNRSNGGGYNVSRRNSINRSSPGYNSWNGRRH